MKYIFTFFYLLLLASCAATTQVASSETSTTVEVHTETVIEKDTVYISLPPIEQSRQTLDTVSVLENNYSRSTASVSAGILNHTLQVKPVNEPVSVEKKIIYRDSIVYVRLAPLRVEVEKKLTYWQSCKMKVGGWAIGILFFAIVVAILYFLFHSKLFSL